MDALPDDLFTRVFFGDPATTTLCQAHQFKSLCKQAKQMFAQLPSLTVDAGEVDIQHLCRFLACACNDTQIDIVCHRKSAKSSRDVETLKRFVYCEDTINVRSVMVKYDVLGDCIVEHHTKEGLKVFDGRMDNFLAVRKLKNDYFSWDPPPMSLVENIESLSLYGPGLQIFTPTLVVALRSLTKLTLHDESPNITTHKGFSEEERIFLSAISVLCMPETGSLRHLDISGSFTLPESTPQRLLPRNLHMLATCGVRSRPRLYGLLRANPELQRLSLSNSTCTDSFVSGRCDNTTTDYTEGVVLHLHNMCITSIDMQRFCTELTWTSPWLVFTTGTYAPLLAELEAQLKTHLVCSTNQNISRHVLGQI